MYPEENVENGSVAKKPISRLLVAEQAETWQPGYLAVAPAALAAALGK
jgi:hypothetical protein